MVVGRKTRGNVRSLVVGFYMLLPLGFMRVFSSANAKRVPGHHFCGDDSNWSVGGPRMLLSSVKWLSILMGIKSAHLGCRYVSLHR